MRGLTKRWTMATDCLATAPAQPIQAVAHLPPLVQRLFAARGLADAEEIQRFCEPRLSYLHDSSLLPDIDIAAQRIIDAIRGNQQIVIYGDYDVDGITATAILYHTFKSVQPAAPIRTYVPHRLEEGYGLNCEALRQLKSQGAQLVITVDCGITAVKSANTAREVGLDLIITDHHEIRGQTSEVRGPRSEITNQEQSKPGPSEMDASSVTLATPRVVAELPNATALVHPNLPGSQYPFADLCGAGVAFKLAWHFARRWCNSDRVSETLQKTLLNMLPLVALGTIADVAPLVGENRVLTAFGLRLIKQSPLVGLRALIEASNLADEKIDSHRVGFALAPRLNACGRMGHAADAVRLLTEAASDEALAIAKRLTQHNIERQGVERRIFEHAARLAEDQGMVGDDCRAIVLAHESWHPGVVGIVCSRMVDRFGRPAVLLHQTQELCKGSARSIDGYSIHDGIASAARYLTTFGGHAMAAGLSLPPAHLQAFAEALVAHANEHISVDHLTPSLTIDCEATLGELDLETVRAVQKMSPFGRGNRSPTLLLRQCTVAEAPRQMGANGKHLSLRLRQEMEGGRRWLRAVWWSAGERAADFAAGMQLDLAIEPKLNEWNGNVSVEAEVRDLRLCQPAAAALAR
jgi:single-stranded-DNA-specific exonuclease